MRISVPMAVVVAVALATFSTAGSAQRPPVPTPCVRTTLTIPAKEFASSKNVAPAAGPVAAYGSDVILNGPDYSERPNEVSYVIPPMCPGRYVLSAEYAAEQARPVQIWINGRLYFGVAMNTPTGGWTPDFQAWRRVGALELSAKETFMEVKSGKVFPHIRAFRLDPGD